MTLIDSNVILDLVSNDERWAPWSIERLNAASQEGPLLINDVIYAEISVRYERMEDLNAMLEPLRINIAPFSKEALFLGGKVYNEYRRRGGPRLGVLPDFFIGAYAAASKLPLLTRNIARYRTYFPDLQIISPATH